MIARTIIFAVFAAAGLLTLSAPAQQLKPTEIVYSRLPNNVNAPPIGTNQPTIWIVGQDGTNDRFLTNGTAPRVSDDGRFLLFKRFTRHPSFFNPFGGFADFFVRELATGTETLILAINFDQGSWGHYFSPESNQGNFEIIADDSCLMYKFNRNGSGITFLYPTSVPAICADDFPSVRRGGDQLIAFHNLSTDSTNGGGLFTVGINGVGRQKIPNTSCGDINATWANDGQFIGYGSYYLTCGASFPQSSYPYFINNLWKIKADGTAKQQLTNFTPGDCGSPSTNCLTFGMVWTEDNSKLITAGRINGVTGLFAFNTNGSAAFAQIPISPGNAPDFVGGIVQPRVDQNVVAIGGGLTTGGTYSLVSTIGEPVAGVTSSGAPYTLESGFWALPQSGMDAPFDFDGDGKTDIAIFRPSGAEWWINRSTNGSTFAAQFGASTDRITPGDFTGDRKTDIAFFRPSTGEWYILRSEDFSFFAFPFGTNGDAPAPADFDGDGKTDAAVYRPSNSAWFIRRSTDGGATIETFGSAGDVPVVSDYDGDGKADIAIYRPSLGQWWVKRSTAAVIAFTFGESLDKPVQGDYTGDGKSDVAFWRPSTGQWFILRSEDYSFYAVPFGVSSDIPAPGDYDGDGKFDTAVFRPSGATWFVDRTTSGTLIQQFGATGDRPVPNAFVP